MNKKIILITGATDGIGFEAAKLLSKEGHILLLHGRNQKKLDSAVKLLRRGAPKLEYFEYLADLSNLQEVNKFTDYVLSNHNKIDVIVNNAGIFKTPLTITEDKLDIRFVVNNIAPYLIVNKLLPLLSADGRIINLSSAAHMGGCFDHMMGKRLDLDDRASCDESKLAITMWSCAMADELANSNQTIIALNPGSLLASKMVKEAFGINGKNILIGANIIAKLATAESIDGSKIQEYNGAYYDNDIGKFAAPHPDALDKDKCHSLVELNKAILRQVLPKLA